MSRILIFTDIYDTLDRHPLEPVNYSILYEQYKSDGGNVGNKFWYQAILKYVYESGNEYEIYNSTMTKEYINEKFTCVIFPQANIFTASQFCIEVMNRWTHFFKDIRIPVYPIGAGIQILHYCEMEELIKMISEPAREYIDAVYQTGGEFAIRGYITKEFMDRISNNSAVVIGCPSIFQTGRNLTINNEKVSKELFKPLINGSKNYLKSSFSKRIFKEYKNSAYIDQEEFIEILYAPNKGEYNDFSNENLKELIGKYSTTALKLITQNRLFLYYDIAPRLNFTLKNNFNFSYGERIHGNLMALILGIPVLIHVIDCRVLELADYLEIPYITNIPQNKSLYDLYCELDYSRFNANYAEKFDRFEDFLKQHNIIKEICQNDEFNKLLEGINYNDPELVDNTFFQSLKKQTNSLYFKKTELMENLKALINR